MTKIEILLKNKVIAEIYKMYDQKINQSLEKLLEDWKNKSKSLHSMFGYSDKYNVDAEKLFFNVWNDLNIEQKEALITKKIIVGDWSRYYYNNFKLNTKNLIITLINSSNKEEFKILKSEKVLKVTRLIFDADIFNSLYNKVCEVNDNNDELIEKDLYEFLFVMQNVINDNRLLSDQIVNLLLKLNEREEINLDKYARILPVLKTHLEMNNGEDIFLNHTDNHFSLDIEFKKILMIANQKPDVKGISLWLNAFIQEYARTNKNIKNTFTSDYCLGTFGTYKKVMIVIDVKDGVNIEKEKEMFKKCVNDFIKTMHDVFSTHASDVKKRKEISKSYLDKYRLNEKLKETLVAGGTKKKVNKV